MNLRPIALVFALCLVSLPDRADSTISFRSAGSTIILLDSIDAAVMSSRPDAYTRAHTPYDLSIRLNGAKGLTTNDYLNAAAKNVRSWPAEEQAQLRSAFATIDSFSRATGIPLHLPDTVMMVKTTAGEEFGAEGYTRENRIMLNTGVQPISVHLLAHELWHVISRHNASLRNKAYAAFHFKPCNNIEYKPALNNLVVTNPDCPYLQHYLTIEKGGKKEDVALIFYTKVTQQDGQAPAQNLSIGVLALTGDDAHKKPLIRNGKPVIYELDETPDLFRQIGKNTSYLLHIEEITAEHFAALITGKQLPQMEFVAGVKAALMN